MAYVVENVPILIFEREFVVQQQIDVISTCVPGPPESSGQIWPHRL